MRVLLTGGTGLIGSPTLDALRSAGHDVLAAVRSGSSAAKVTRAGATAAIGDITDVAWLGEQLGSVDGAIHLAADNDGPGMDEAVTDAVIAAFGGSDKPFVHTGGLWVWGDGSDISEDDPQRPPTITAWRSGPEGKLLAADVQATVIAPGVVYGPGGAGIPMMIKGGPTDESGALVLLGSGDQHWATVAASDLAELYVIALEQSEGHTVYIGAGGQNPTVRAIGEAIVGADGAVVAGTAAEAKERLGDLFAEALLLDQQASGSKARVDLGWEPNARSLLTELAAARD